MVEGPAQSRDIEIILSAKTPSIWTLDEGCRIRIINSLDQASQHEVYELAFQHKGSLDSVPHRPKAKEQLMVTAGVLEITSGASKALVRARNSTYYDDICPYAIRSLNGCALAF